MQKSRVIPTSCPPVDALLGGGLLEGHILDISGPPGSPKDLILLSLVRSCVETGKKVLFVGVLSQFHLRAMLNIDSA